MPLLPKPPSYTDLVQHHALSVLFGGGDLAIEDGELKLTRDGDLFFGTPTVNAMHRLVSAWSYNEPAMHLLFQTVRETRAQRIDLEKEVERSLRAANPFIPGNPGAGNFATYHVAQEALDAGEVGCGALSASIMVVASNLLSRFRGDLCPAGSDWTDAQPAIRGISVGRLVTAAANAFRHADEWAAARHARTITAQQKASMDVLEQALAISPYSFSDKREWEHAMDAIAVDDFSRFAGSVLGFANDVARRTADRTA